MNSLDSFNKVIVCLAFHDAETGVLNEITKIGRNIADNVNMDFMDYVRQVVKSGPADETLLNDAKQNVEKPLMGIFAQYNMVLKRINQISAELQNITVSSHFESAAKDRKYIASVLISTMYHGLQEGVDQCTDEILKRVCQYETEETRFTCIISDENSYSIVGRRQCSIEICALLGKRVSLFEIPKTVITNVAPRSTMESCIKKLLEKFTNTHCSYAELKYLKLKLSEQFPPDIWNCAAITKGKMFRVRFQPKELENKLLFFNHDTKVQSVFIWAWTI